MKSRFALLMVLGLVWLAAGRVSMAAADDPQANEAAAIKRIQELGGKIEYDAQKNIIGVDCWNAPRPTPT